MLPVTFSCRRIFTPFREHVTSCRSSYRSVDEESTAVPCIHPHWYNGVHGQSTGDTLHANRKRYISLVTRRGDSKFSKLPTPVQALSLIRLCPLSVLYVTIRSKSNRTQTYAGNNKNLNVKTEADFLNFILI